MIVVSSDGRMTIPFEHHVFECCSLGDLTDTGPVGDKCFRDGLYFVIICYVTNDYIEIIGAYDTEEKARIEFNALKNAYYDGNKIIRLDSNNDMSNYLRGKPFNVNERIKEVMQF